MAIAQNPHAKDPQELWKALEEESGAELKPVELDVRGFNMLKQKMQENPRIAVK